MLVADDFHLESAGESYRSALLVFFVVCSVTGVPLAWSKTAGRLRASPPPSPGRDLPRHAEWSSRWTRETASADQIHIGKFRPRYECGRCTRIRATLFRSAVQVHVNPSSELRAPCPRLGFLYSPVSRPADTGIEAPRVDAQASLTRTGFGGSISTRFSLEILEKDWPWIFKKGRKPSLVISALEALTVLIALKLFHGNQICPPSHSDPGLSNVDQGAGRKVSQVRQHRSGRTRQRCTRGFRPEPRARRRPLLRQLGDPSGGAEDGRARGSRGPERSHKR